MPALATLAHHLPAVRFPVPCAVNERHGSSTLNSQTQPLRHAVSLCHLASHILLRLPLRFVVADASSRRPPRLLGQAHHVGLEPLVTPST